MEIRYRLLTNEIWLMTASFSEEISLVNLLSQQYLGKEPRLKWLGGQMVRFEQLFPQ